MVIFLRQGVIDVPIYGRIAAMELFRPPVSSCTYRNVPAEPANQNSCDRPLLLPQGKDKDLLFFLTEQHQFSVLEYDTNTGER